MIKFVDVVTVAVVTKNHLTVNLRGVIPVRDLDFAERNITIEITPERVDVDGTNRPANLHRVQLHHTVFVTFHCGINP